eukprot:GFYU01005650.1.p2 GENE.GFYU01005650.1~~GFYU01005650.1.p2  ORF type:complete len:278 (-),score=110.42 GFYU01005650.1:119-952(-)
MTGTVDESVSNMTTDINKRYSEHHILRYEWVFGKEFVSPGGEKMTKELCDKVFPIPSTTNNQPVCLDVGSGSGGAGFYMIRAHNAKVVGIDLAKDMVVISNRRVEEKKIQSVASFHCEDALTAPASIVPTEGFDLVWSRDTFLHIGDKEKLFKNLYSWLKPGGKLLISDYNCGIDVDKSSDEFKAYVAQRGYFLLTVEKYGKVVEAAGFKNVQAQDRSKQWTDVLTGEVKKLEDMKDAFVTEFSQKDYDDLEHGWKAKLVRCANNQQVWGVYYGEKA